MTRQVSAFFVSLLLLLGLDAANAQKAPSGSIASGVFTAAQAQRGKTAYMASCAICHGANLITRDNDASTLSGPDFEEAWHGRTLAERFERIKTTMPQDAEGSLSDQAYIDIVAFILQYNGYPAGGQELKPDPAALKTIVVEPAKKP